MHVRRFAQIHERLDVSMQVFVRLRELTAARTLCSTQSARVSAPHCSHLFWNTGEHRAILPPRPRKHPNGLFSFSFEPRGEIMDLHTFIGIRGMTSVGENKFRICIAYAQ